MNALQQQLLSVFNGLKAILKKYEPSLTPKLDMESRYDLWSFKEVEISGRKKKEVSFAALIIQSNYVGFYFMPVYADTDMKEFFAPELLRLQKGKSCFHIRSLDAELIAQIEAALEKGYALYQERGWV